MKSVVFPLWIAACAVGLSACNQPAASVPKMASAPEGTRLVNVDSNGLALQGYDPVAYFHGGKPQKGLSQYSAAHEGATYYFASAENRAAFEMEPAKYVPQFGGYCAYGVSVGGLFPVDVNTGTLVGGRLMLNKNAEVAAMFAKDPEGYVAKADKQWPELVKARGK
jgi:YHS domain-containing protein